MVERRGRPRCEIPTGERGHLLVALMVLIAVMLILLTVTGQSWTFLARRDAEAELIFRGEQYAKAIQFYQQETGSFPTDLKLLGQPGPHRHRYIRKLWKDPLSKDGKWGKLYLSPTGKGYINPYATRRDQQSFLAGTFGDDRPGRGSRFNGPGRSGGPGGDRGGILSEEQAEENSGYTEMGAEEFEQFGGEQAGMPIVGVVHKKKESGLKIYMNLANLNDWAFTILAQGQQTEFSRPPAAPPPPLMRGRGVGDSSTPINIPGRGTGSRFSPGDSHFNPATESRNQMREAARRKAEEERRRQEEENPRDQQPSDDEQWDESDDDQDEEQPYDDEDSPDDDEDYDDEQSDDPNAPAQDPNAPNDPNAPSDPNHPSENQNSQISRIDGVAPSQKPSSRSTLTEPSGLRL